jgi:hypothetical protein
MTRSDLPRTEKRIPFMGGHASMDGARFDALARGCGQRISRRGGLRLLAMAMAIGASLPLAHDGRADKDKGDKNRRKRRKEHRRAAEAQTCDDCAGKCALCIAGPSVPLQCGEQVNIFCNFHCSSDDDCLDSRPDYPHCVSRWVTRATGKITTGAEACAGIAAPSAAYCSQIAPCA